MQAIELKPSDFPVIPIISHSLASSTQPLPAPEVSSPTHSNAEMWYSNNSPKFEWSVASDTAAASFVLDQNSSTIPNNVVSSTDSYQAQSLDDGIWYFHLRIKSGKTWSDTTHFAARIDSKPPEAFSLVLLDGNAGSEPGVLFTTTDSGSGIDHYEVQLNGAKVSDVQPSERAPYYIAQLSPERLAQAQVAVIAFDRAGNKTLASASFSPETTAIQLALPYIAIGILAFLLLVALAMIAIFVKKHKEAANAGANLVKNALAKQFAEFEGLKTGLSDLRREIKNFADVKAKQSAFSFIYKSREDGLSDTEIRNELQSSGWQNEDIDPIFEEEAAVRRLLEKAGLGSGQAPPSDRETK